MVRHYTRAHLILAIKDIIAQGAHDCRHRGHGRAGRLLEDLLPRNSKHQPGAIANLVRHYGWDSDHHGATVKSFRATLYGKWSNAQDAVTLKVSADDHKIRILHNALELAWWDSNALIIESARDIFEVKSAIFAL